MPVKLTAIPEELRVLMAEFDARTVVLGNTAYTMTALAEYQVVKFCQVINAVFSEIFSAFDSGASKETIVGKAFNVVMESGKIPQIIAILLDEDEKVVSANLTIKQAIHILSEAYDLNLNTEALPEGVRKNLKKLTSLFLPQNEMSQHPSFQEFTLEALEILEQQVPAEEKVTRIKEASRRHMTVELSTSPSPTNAALPESTSTEAAT